MKKMARCYAIRWLIGACATLCLGAQITRAQDAYPSAVLQDKPTAYWRFGAKDRMAVRSAAGDALSGQAVRGAQLGRPGARPPRYLTLDKENTALAIPGNGYVKVADPGDNSPLDFGVGDTITLEAWVDLHGLSDGQNIYVVGKGRTNNEGFARENQNYALRLRGIGGTARVSFLFRNGNNGKDPQADYHRWNSDRGFAPGNGWHHVAVSYTFGKPESIRGYVDGKPVTGTWDMAGPTKDGPVVDNDELWIGSALGGSPNSTFNGLIDEVAIYRHAVPAERIDDRYRIDATKPIMPEADLPDAPQGKVLVQVFEGVPEGSFQATGEPTCEFTTDSLALVHLPTKYNSKGLIADWRQPLMVRAITNVSEPAGKHHVLLRAKDMTRVRIGGRVVAATGRMNKNASGHEKVPQLAESDDPLLRPLTPGIREKAGEYTFNGQPQTVVVESMIGSQKLRPEIRELVVAMANEGETFRILSPTTNMPLTEANWNVLASEQHAWLVQFNQAQRARVSAGEREYWQRRHNFAREHLAKVPAIEIPPGDAANPVDRFINARLKANSLTPANITDDWEFLRRVTLDTVGVIPSPREIREFLSAKTSERRADAIDRLLHDPRWADHWVSYWQDVLAENPNILKGKLNNTGPFRWWIYESLLDNKPADRFATELIMMEGSKWYGGPAGFGLATQNDAPLAAKAHVIGKSFLAVEMKCARCHDAPYHDVTQQDTFNIAAMLARGGQKIPKTSVVPVVKGARPPEVTISLKPGQTVSPKWPFDELADSNVPQKIIRNSDDHRQRLAAIITSPTNDRFAKVMVNRLWARLMGRGIVEPIDDWEGVKPSHPELLAWLARELIAHNYDMKHVARLIFTSQAYQRKVRPDASGEERLYFATPTRRRMTAEQIVDSLFAAAGKGFAAEELSLDPEGRRPVESFLNLGRPTRAWQFTSLSNERDRPALALPQAQSIQDVLVTFGWRESRQDPLAERETEPTVLQPAVLANGLVGRRITTLSDDSALTRIALDDQTPQQFVDAVFARLLSRRSTTTENELFVELLRDGYDKRIVQVETNGPQPAPRRTAVSWSNHLSAEATKIKLELERRIRAGDPPTKRLDTDWRERAEDMVWALLNSPEFVFVP